MKNEQELLQNIDKIHTTKLGVIRIKKNLSLETDHVVAWCKSRITSENTTITKQGKNWYVMTDNCVITINAHSFTIITAHIIDYKK